VSVARQLPEADSFFKIGLVGFLVPGDFPPTPVLLHAPVGRELVVSVLPASDIHEVARGSDGN
jgi:hypothetical protein